MQTIKNGRFVAEEIGKINANFAEIESDYAKHLKATLFLFKPCLNLV